MSKAGRIGEVPRHRFEFRLRKFIRFEIDVHGKPPDRRKVARIFEQPSGAPGTTSSPMFGMEMATKFCTSVVAAVEERASH